MPRQSSTLLRVSALGAAAYLASNAFVTVAPSAQSSYQAVSQAPRAPAPAATGSRQLAGRRQASRRKFVACRANEKEENPYDVIGVERGASQKDARKAFRKIAVKEHPDVKPDDPDADKKFQRLVAAYNLIMGDELMADELTEIRVQATKEYKEKMNNELNKGANLTYQGPARAIQGAATVAFFGVLYYFTTLDPATLNSILSPTPTRPPGMQRVYTSSTSSSQILMDKSMSASTSSKSP